MGERTEKEVTMSTVEQLESRLADAEEAAKILDEAGMENGDKYAVASALLKDLSNRVIGLKLATPEGLAVKDFARHCEAELMRIRHSRAISGDRQ